MKNIFLKLNHTYQLKRWLCNQTSRGGAAKLNSQWDNQKWCNVSNLTARTRQTCAHKKKTPDIMDVSLFLLTIAIGGLIAYLYYSMTYFKNTTVPHESPLPLVGNMLPIFGCIKKHWNKSLYIFINKKLFLMPKYTFCKMEWSLIKRD